jgi:hypothetical protein
VTITLEEIQTRQSELATMIAKFTAQAAAQPARIITANETYIELRPGEQFAGAVLGADGQHKHHLVLMADSPRGKLNWSEAMAWAAHIGGSLPDRQEQALLYANCKPHLKPEWHWSSEEHADDASFAWFCDFYDGSQSNFHESYEGCARAVRRA